jgi:hypothetical protein
MGVLIGWVVSDGSGTDSAPGLVIFPSIYPSSPFDPSNCVMLVFHWSRLSPLNFCSSDSIVSEGMPDIINGRGYLSGWCIKYLWSLLSFACQLSILCDHEAHNLK